MANFRCVTGDYMCRGLFHLWWYIHSYINNDSGDGRGSFPGSRRGDFFTTNERDVGLFKEIYLDTVIITRIVHIIKQ